MTTLAPVLEPPNLTLTSNEPSPATKSTKSNLEKFHNILRDLESPNHYITWNYLYLVSSCLGRKIWLGTDFQIFPNLFLVFVAEPGFGKSLPASKGVEMLRALIDIENKGDGNIVEKPLVKISPDSVTLEALWMELAAATEKVKICDKPPRFYVHSSVSFCLGDEMGTLFRDKTNDLVTFLTHAWDCRAFFHRKTKSHGEVSIVNMCVNLLGCATPDWISRNFQTALINEGFAARVIFIYGDKPRHRKARFDDWDFGQREDWKDILKHLRALAKLPAGSLSFERGGEADKWYQNWVNTKFDKPINTERCLKDYYSRKRVHLQKLAMVCHFAEKTSLTLDVDDFEKADKILESTEVDMHLALATTGRNPVNNLAQAIRKNIEINKRVSHVKILLDHFNGGNRAEIEDAINFLKDTDKIKGEINKEDNKVYYYASEPEQKL